MSSRARLEITVHIGQAIPVSAIFVFAYKVKLQFLTLLVSPVQLIVRALRDKNRSRANCVPIYGDLYENLQ